MITAGDNPFRLRSEAAAPNTAATTGIVADGRDMRFREDCATKLASCAMSSTAGYRFFAESDGLPAAPRAGT